MRGRHRHDAPQPALDADRRADGRAEAELAGDIGGRAGDAGVVIEARRPARLEYQRVDVPPADTNPGADGNGGAGTAPRGDHPYRPVGVIPAHRRVAGTQQPPRLLGNRREHLARRCRAGHQRRHAAQRRLLIGDPVVAASFRRRSHHVGCTPFAVPVPGPS